MTARRGELETARVLTLGAAAVMVGVANWMLVG